MKKLKGYASKIIKLPEENTYDRIYAHYIESRHLSKRDNDVKIRWEKAFTLLCQFNTNQDVAATLAKIYDVSISQAYRDIKNATRLFGNFQESTKEGIRAILWDYSMQCLKLAKNEKNLQEMNKAIANMIKIRGIDKDDLDIPSFENLQQNNYNIVYNPSLVGAQKIDNLEEVIRSFNLKKQTKDLMLPEEPSEEQ